MRSQCLPVLNPVLSEFPRSLAACDGCQSLPSHTLVESPACTRWYRDGQGSRRGITYRSEFAREIRCSNRAIVLITDGHITGEDALLRLLDSMPQYEVPRLFCMGVDRAVNGSVLERLTRRTHGTYELVESEIVWTKYYNGFQMKLPVLR